MTRPPTGSPVAAVPGGTGRDGVPIAGPAGRQVGGVPRAWQRMLSGRRLDLLDPSPLDIEIEDIAHGLARVARWNGQTMGEHIFSVAQHTLLVGEIARRQTGASIAGSASPCCSMMRRNM